VYRDPRNDDPCYCDQFTITMKKVRRARPRHGETVKKSQLLKAIQDEIQRHNLDTFMSAEHKIVQTGCSADKSGKAEECVRSTGTPIGIFEILKSSGRTDTSGSRLHLQIRAWVATTANLRRQSEILAEFHCGERVYGIQDNSEPNATHGRNPEMALTPWFTV
jgi:hypothetical protein